MTTSYPIIVSPWNDVRELLIEQIAYHLLRGNAHVFTALRTVAKKAGLSITDADLQNYTALPYTVRQVEWAHARRRTSQKRARPYNLETHFTALQLLQVLSRAAGSCEVCKADLPLTVEHKVPLSEGGSNAIENIALCCEGCNAAFNSVGDDYLKQITAWQGW